MFYCQVTNQMTKPGEKVNKLVIAKRERIYSRKIRNEETNRWEDIDVGYGWEIVKEVNACDEGVRIFNAMTPEDQAAFCAASV